MWILWGIYPAASGRFNGIEIGVSLTLLTGLTIYGLFYKESK